MADQVVQINPDGTGKKIDTSELAVGTNTVERQRINIADPATAAGLAQVMNSVPAGTEYGLVVRQSGPIEVTDGTNVLGTTAHPVVVQQSHLTAATDVVAVSAAQFLLDHSFGSVTNRNSKNSPATLFGFVVTSFNIGLVYWQLFNKASAPASADVPLYSFPIPVGGGSSSASFLSLDTSFFGLGGMPFSLGLSWGISSTGGTFTDAGTPTNYTVHVHYL